MRLRLSTFAACVLALLPFTGVLATCPSAIPDLPLLDLPTVVPPPVASCSAPTPPAVTGYLPFTFVNNTGVAASDIFIVVLVNSSTQYLSFGTIPSTTHIGATISNFTPTTYISSTSSPAYTYPLSSFESLAADEYTFYIPNDGNSGVVGSNVMASSRILVSLHEPLTYFINNLGVLQLPAEFDATNDNYYILNDKIEFDLGSNAKNRLNLNLTGVDFFGLPMLVQANYQFFYGSSYTQACAVTGMPTTVSLDDVFTGYTDALASLSSPFDTYWEGLIATYTNPASGGGDVCNLRIYAPATAMGSTQTQSNPSPVSFPTNYFLNSAISPSSCSWFNAVWSGGTSTHLLSYYQNQKPVPYLILDATTDGGAATATGYETSNGSFTFVVNGGPDAGNSVIFPTPTSTKAFFTGAVSDYVPAIGGNASAATQAQLLKVFATSIISGLFPINCQTNPPITITNTYLQNHPAGYFANNSILNSYLSSCSCVANVPWYDFYSRTLLTIGTPNFFYTSAYSDFLGIDGTIVITSLADHNADATITVNLNDCSTNINTPDPYSDTTVYNLVVGIPENTVVGYGTSAAGPFTTTIPSTTQGNQLFLQVTYNSGIYNGTTVVTQVAPAAQIFHPILPGQGVVVTSGTNTNVTIGASPSS